MTFPKGIWCLAAILPVKIQKFVDFAMVVGVATVGLKIHLLNLFLNMVLWINNASILKDVLLYVVKSVLIGKADYIKQSLLIVMGNLVLIK